MRMKRELILGWVMTVLWLDLVMIFNPPDNLRDAIYLVKKNQ